MVLVKNLMSRFLILLYKSNCFFVHRHFCIFKKELGAWLSWLERLLHTQEISGSNPLAPTLKLKTVLINHSIFPFKHFSNYIINNQMTKE